jgi:hypothetical protein
VERQVVLTEFLLDLSSQATSLLPSVEYQQLERWVAAS